MHNAFILYMQLIINGRSKERSPFDLDIRMNGPQFRWTRIPVAFQPIAGLAEGTFPPQWLFQVWYSPESSVQHSLYPLWVQFSSAAHGYSPSLNVPCSNILWGSPKDGTLEISFIIRSTIFSLLMSHPNRHRVMGHWRNETSSNHYYFFSSSFYSTSRQRDCAHGGCA